jgi:hypothetical protein
MPSFSLSYFLGPSKESVLFSKSSLSNSYTIMCVKCLAQSKQSTKGDVIF